MFLRDILTLALTAFGGPQAHLAYFNKLLVDKRKYVTEAELMEINSLCQILPGPASTQTLTAIGFKIGGPTLAYLTLLVWILTSGNDHDDCCHDNVQYSGEELVHRIYKIYSTHGRWLCQLRSLCDKHEDHSHENRICDIGRRCSDVVFISNSICIPNNITGGWTCDCT